jgi:hypothetical protein
VLALLGIAIGGRPAVAAEDREGDDGDILPREIRS